MQSLLFLSFFSLFSSLAFAYENIELDLSSGASMSLNRYQGEGKTLLLWLPSERGFGKSYIPVALNLAAMEYDVWAVNLHDSYFIPPGRQSLREVPLQDLLELLSLAQDEGFERLYIISSGRGMQLALKMSLLWQQQHNASAFIRGLLSFSPHLISGRTQLGEEASYIELASQSNLPVYLFQPQYSTKFARSQEIAQRLARGGSQVYIHALKGVQGGFHMRPDEDLTQTDLDMRKQLAHIMASAVRLLGNTRIAPVNQAYQLSEKDNEVPESAFKMPSLHPFTGDKTAPKLSLSSLKERPVELNELQGSVVLINFWATWCGPCVEEIPSLSRLVERLKGSPFKVVAVNIGESAEDIQAFLELKPVNFEILLDKNGVAVRDWNVYAYPSNYLIDKSGLIQFSYRGALEWDSPSIIETIESLL